jgi:predicted nucleotidyltransferase
MASEIQTDLNLISLDALKRAVHNALVQTGLDIIAIYLHGSYATAHQREESDVDLAVLPERALSLEEGLSFSVALQTELGSCEIDLADLRRANTVFAAQVVTNGRRIYTANPEAADRFEMLTLSQYASLNEERAEILDDIKRRGRIFKEKVFSV